MKNLITYSIFAFLILTSQFFNGCVKETNNEYPDVIASNDTISGILKYKQPASSGGAVVAWPYGEATLTVSAGSSALLTTATVNADGTFTAILPGTVSGSYLISLADVAYSQSGTVNATPNTVRFLSTIQYLVNYTENGSPKSISVNLYTLKSDFSIAKSYYYNFYDMDGTFTGTSYGGNVFNWTFTKGWGMVENQVTNNTTKAFSSKSLGAAPAGAVWVNL